MVYVSGVTSGPYAGFATIAYRAATGDAVWIARYSISLAFPGATVVVASPDGSRVLVGGTISDPKTIYDYALIAYDAATGSRLWTRRYDGPGHSTDYLYGVALSPDGSRVFVTGHSSRRKPALSCDGLRPSDPGCSRAGDRSRAPGADSLGLVHPRRGR